MAKKLQILRGTTAQNDAYTGSIGELTMDTEKVELRIHDGTTQGGKAINDTGFIAHQAMPDLSRAYNITLPASGNHITAPNDGYFLIVFNVSSNGFLVVGDNYYHANSNGGYIGGLVPVKKNRQLFFQHLNLVESIKQQFVPAVGA